MNAKQLDQGIFVTGQLGLADIDAMAAAGFRSIINNRPDGEVPGQPTSAELERRARANSVAYHHIPVSPGDV